MPPHCAGLVITKPQVEPTLYINHLAFHCPRTCTQNRFYQDEIPKKESMCFNNMCGMQDRVALRREYLPRSIASRKISGLRCQIYLLSMEASPMDDLIRDADFATYASVVSNCLGVCIELVASGPFASAFWLSYMAASEYCID